MPHYSIIDKASGHIEKEIKASSSKQALFLMAHDKAKSIKDEQARKRASIIYYKVLEKSYEALLLNDPNQMELPL